MSVIFSQRTPGRRWLSLWPLALFLLLMLVGGLWIWQAWPQVMLKSALWQRDVNQQLSALLNAVATHPERAGGSLLLLSFMYGVLHALGPGHGKVVIATWLATHPSKLKSSIVLTLAAALLQGFVAIGLVVGVLTVLQLPARQLHLSGFWLEKGSYALVGGLGILLCWRAIKGYARCYVNLSLSLLRRAMFTMKNAAADISIYRRRNNCIAAMTGARDS